MPDPMGYFRLEWHSPAVSADRVARDVGLLSTEGEFECLLKAGDELPICTTIQVKSQSLDQRFVALAIHDRECATGDLRLIGVLRIVCREIGDTIDVTLFATKDGLAIRANSLDGKPLAATISHER